MFGCSTSYKRTVKIGLRTLACLMFAPSVTQFRNISPTRCWLLHVFACVLICISHSLTLHFIKQWSADLPLNSHQPSAKSLRANGDLVHTDMSVPQRRVVKPAAPLFSPARHATKITALWHFLLSCAMCSKQVQKEIENGCWSQYNRVSGLFIRRGLLRVLAPVKGADVGQALPPHRHQGQH